MILDSKSFYIGCLKTFSLFLLFFFNFLILFIYFFWKEALKIRGSWIKQSENKEDDIMSIFSNK